MSTASQHVNRLAIATTSLVAVVAVGIQAKKPVKSVGEPHRYRVEVLEPYPGQPVFWAATDEITGRITDDGDTWLLVNQNVVGGVNPTATWTNLPSFYIDDSITDGDWTVCFPQTITGTVTIRAADASLLCFSFTASGRNGKSLWYVFVADAVPAQAGNLYAIDVGQSISLSLHGWALAAGNGPLAKGCIGSGDLMGDFAVTVTRLPDTYPDVP